jgi:hypothetical protein
MSVKILEKSEPRKIVKKEPELYFYVHDGEESLAKWDKTRDRIHKVVEQELPEPVRNFCVNNVLFLPSGANGWRDMGEKPIDNIETVISILPNTPKGRIEHIILDAWTHSQSYRNEKEKEEFIRELFRKKVEI